MKQVLVITLIGLAVSLLSGCGMSNGARESLPGASVVGTSSPKDPESVRLYKNGEKPEKPVITIAKVGAHGNGYADKTVLEQRLRIEAAKLGADCVIVTNFEVTKDETVGTYSGGMMIANNIQRPHLYGVACRYANACVGFFLNNERECVVRYVKANSPAEKIGLVEGCTLLAINSIPMNGTHAVVEKEILSKNPGDKVTLEWLDKSGTKVKKEATLVAP